MELQKSYDELLAKVSKSFIDWLNGSEDNNFLDGQVVFMGDDKFSAGKPLASMGYVFCRALVGFDGKEMYLSHILYQESPEKFIKKLLEKQKNGGIEVIIVDALVESESPLKKECDNLGLKISAFYPQDKHLIDFDGSGTYWDNGRSIVADPNNAVVYIRTIPEVMHSFKEKKDLLS
jgi:hypothetical protein